MKGLRSGDIDVYMIFRGGAEFRLSEMASVSDLVQYTHTREVQSLRAVDRR